MKTTKGQTDRWFFALFLLFVLPMTGCQDGTSGQVISGKITFQGQTVTVGNVTFSNAGTGSVAQGPLDAEGRYTLLQTRALEPGKYAVTITPKVTYEKLAGEREGNFKTLESGGESIPRIYRNNATTRLTATVTGGKESFDFELKD